MSNLILISWHLIIIAVVLLITQVIMQSEAEIAVAADNNITSTSSNSSSNYSVKLINLTNWIPPSSSDVNNSLAFVDGTNASYRLVSKLNNYTECLAKAFELFWTEATAFDDILNEIIRKIDIIYTNIGGGGNGNNEKMSDDKNFTTKIFTKIILRYQETFVRETNNLKIVFEEYYVGILNSSMKSYKELNEIMVENLNDITQIIKKFDDFTDFESINSIITRFFDFYIGIENKILRQALFLSNSRHKINSDIQNISVRFDEYHNKFLLFCEINLLDEDSSSLSPEKSVRDTVEYDTIDAVSVSSCKCIVIF